MFFLGIINLAIAQAPISSKLSENIPNSPEAMNFSKYGLIPVTLYSGMPNVSIPLYTLKDGSLEVPITLSYHNKGYKPSEIANNTGLGWAVQAGGMITRIVRGQVDENPSMTSVDNYIGIAELKMKFQDYPDISKQRYSQKILKEISNGLSDGEPDIYTFNFNGYSGNFVIINGEAILMPKQNLKISVIPTYYGNTFKIITENGTIYMFGITGLEKTYPSFHTDGPPVLVNSYISAWHLTSITSFDKIHSISFQYDSVKYKRVDAISGVYNLAYEGTGQPTGSYSTFKNYGASVTSMILNNISTLSGNCKISFVGGGTRNDIKDYLGANTIKTLGSLEVKTQTGLFIKKWVFNYGYFGIAPNNKLKLVSINQLDEIGNSTNSQSFNYYDENTSLPDNNTLGIDHWGYFNGKTNNRCLIPAELCPNGSMVGCIPGIRTPDPTYSKYTVLSKISYPTGGYSVFTYEPNRFFVADGGSNLQTTQQTVDLQATYDSQKAIWDVDNYYIKTSQTFPVCVNQEVSFYYHFTMPNFTSTSTGAKIFYPVFTIRKISDVCDDSPSTNPNTVIYRRTGQFYPIDNLGTYRVDETINLDPGIYIIEIKIDPEISSIYGSLVYLSTDGTLKPGDMGPGLRIAGISTYDSDGTKLTEKKYEYKTDQGLSSGLGGGLQYSISSYEEIIYLRNHSRTITHKSITGNLEQNIGSMLNEKFYYSKVTEYNVGITNNQKSDYYFTAYDEIYGGVKLIKQVDYTFINGRYKKIHSKLFDYRDISAERYVMCLQSKFVGKHISGEQYAYVLPFLNYEDPLDPNTYLEFYEGSCPTLQIGDLKLFSDTEKSYIYSSSDSTIMDSVINEIKYKYTPLTSHNPYEIEQSTSSGNLKQTDPKYSYNYKLLSSSIKTPDQIKSSYITALTNIINTFDINRTTDINGFKTYYNAYNALRQNKDSEINTFETALQNQIFVEPDPNSKAILMMQQGNNVSTPIEQKHYFIDNTVKKLLGAEKTVFGIKGISVEDKEVWTYEISNPIDSASFNNLNYIKRLELMHDEKLNIVNQKLNNDLDHSYIWGYNKNYLIAEIKNANTSECDYTGFENHEAPGWSVIPEWFTDNTADVRTGKSAVKTTGYGPTKYFSVGTIASTHSGYKASVWVRGGTDAYLHIQVNDDYSLSKRVTNPTNSTNSYNLIEVELPYTIYKNSVSPTMMIKVYCGSTGPAFFDDLRFYPMDAQMTNYTYDPLIGVTSVSDVNNKPTIYKYDAFNRLWYISDFKGNILKKYDYHYKL